MKKTEMRRCEHGGRNHRGARLPLGPETWEEVYAALLKEADEEQIMKHPRTPDKPRIAPEDVQDVFETPVSQLTASIAAQIRSRLVDDVKAEILSALEDVIAGLDGSLATQRENETPSRGDRKSDADLARDRLGPADRSSDPWLLPWATGPSQQDNGTRGAVDPNRDGVYEGTVRLRVGGDRSAVLLMLRFVSDLRHRSEFRVLRLVRNDDGGADVLVGLRLPLELDQVLSEIDNVASVRALPTDGPEPTLNIELAHAY